MFQYTHERPAVTVDVVTIRDTPRGWEVLLIERGLEPFGGYWALPGGFVEPEETVEAAAERELLEETKIQAPLLGLIGVFSKPGRDPRGWTISTAFLAIVPPDVATTAGDDAKRAAWFNVRTLPKLAFDHAEILGKAIALLPQRRPA